MHLSMCLDSIGHLATHERLFDKLEMKMDQEMIKFFTELDRDKENKRKNQLKPEVIWKRKKNICIEIQDAKKKTRADNKKCMTHQTGMARPGNHQSLMPNQWGCGKLFWVCFWVSSCVTICVCNKCMIGEIAIVLNFEFDTTNKKSHVSMSFTINFLNFTMCE